MNVQSSIMVAAWACSCSCSDAEDVAFRTVCAAWVGCIVGRGSGRGSQVLKEGPRQGTELYVLVAHKLCYSLIDGARADGSHSHLAAPRRLKKKE